MSTDFLDKLNPEQREAASTVEGPLLIIAGAGSGKTTVLVNRLAYMIESGINPANILLLTFTNTAADNMKERAKKLGNSKCGEVTACTYHSFCAKELRKYAREINLDPNFTIISPSEAADAIKFAKVELGLTQRKGMPNNATIVSILSKAVNTGRTVGNIVEKECDKYAEFVYDINQLGEYFTKYKREKGLCDYDDLLVHMNELLSIPRIRKELENTYKYVMVDEYQDTNKLQEKIVMMLCKSRRNLCVVGDDYQSIFSFTGSDINNILKFPERIGGCREVVIATNYRSTKEVLDVANNIMNNYADFGFKKEMKSCNKCGPFPNIITTEDQAEEAKYVVSKIKMLLSQGKSLEDAAVLFRSSFSTMYLELFLGKAGIPFRKLGGLKFLDHVCIQDVLAFLRILTNPSDELAWYRILCILPGIGDVYASQITKKCSRDLSFLTAGYEKRKFVEYLKMLKSAVEEASRCKQCDWMEVVTRYYFYFREETIRVANVSDEGKRTEMLEELERDKFLVAQLTELSSKYTKIADFLDSVALDATAPSGEDELLTLSTIHSAKGMEWDNVFVLDCVDGVFPKYPEKCRGEDNYYEELRCFYVAITRAKTNLTILCPQVVQINGKMYEGIPSHFLRDCYEKKLIETEVSEKKNKKIYLSVPYDEKDKVKHLGGKWDGEVRRWYYYSNGNNDIYFKKWRVG